MGLDLKSKAVSMTSELHLKDSEGELMFAEYDDDGRGVKGTEGVAVVYGPGSIQYARAQAAQQTRNVKRLQKKGKIEQTPEEAQEEKVEFMSAITKELRNLDYDGLQGTELIRAVYGDREIGFIVDQVAEYAHDWANFTKPSAKN